MCTVTLWVVRSFLGRLPRWSWYLIMATTGSLPQVADGSEPVTIIVPEDVPLVSLLGPGDEVLKTLDGSYPELSVLVRGNEFTVKGPAAVIEEFAELLGELFTVVRRGGQLTPDSVQRAVAMLRGSTLSPSEVLTQSVLSHKGKTIRPKTVNQHRYVEAIEQNTVVFGVGPAGTGKTYLAVAKAVDALHTKQVSRIILTRPAVEAGEKLGFLPGTLNDKIDPYLRPLYDALHDMVNPETIPRLMESGTIEVAPLAYMRGRTLNDAFIILDEAQNTSPEQMKMFLTRLGFGSTMVITGDDTQVDLPSGMRSGLTVATRILNDVEDIAVITLTGEDVVRHKLVGDIVHAYEQYDHSGPVPLRHGGSNMRRPGRSRGGTDER